MGAPQSLSTAKGVASPNAPNNASAIPPNTNGFGQRSLGDNSRALEKGFQHPDDLFGLSQQMQLADHRLPKSGPSVVSLNDAQAPGVKSKNVTQYLVWSEDGLVDSAIPVKDIPTGVSLKSGWWIHNDGKLLQVAQQYPETEAGVRDQLRKEGKGNSSDHDVQRRVDAGKELNRDIESFMTAKNMTLSAAIAETKKVHINELEVMVLGAAIAFSAPLDAVEAPSRPSSGRALNTRGSSTERSAQAKSEASPSDPPPASSQKKGVPRTGQPGDPTKSAKASSNANQTPGPQSRFRQDLIDEHGGLLHPKVADDAASGALRLTGKGKGGGPDVILTNGHGREVSVHTGKFTEQGIVGHLIGELQRNTVSKTTEIYLQFGKNTGGSRAELLKMLNSGNLKAPAPDLAGVRVRFYGPNGSLWWKGTLRSPAQ